MSTLKFFGWDVEYIYLPTLSKIFVYYILFKKKDTPNTDLAIQAIPREKHQNGKKGKFPFFDFI